MDYEAKFWKYSVSSSITSRGQPPLITRPPCKAQGVRTSTLKHISLRKNRINTASAVFLALMIRDFPLSTEIQPSPQSSTSPRSTSPDRPRPQPNAFESSNSVSIRQGFNRSNAPLVSTENSDVQGESYEPGLDKPSNPAAQAEREAWKADEVRMRLKQQIADLPRVGSLLTLDVKGNDLRVSHPFLRDSVPCTDGIACFTGRSNLHLASSETKPDAQSSQLEREQD